MDEARRATLQRELHGLIREAIEMMAAEITATDPDGPAKMEAIRERTREAVGNDTTAATSVRVLVALTKALEALGSDYPRITEITNRAQQIALELVGEDDAPRA